MYVIWLLVIRMRLVALPNTIAMQDTMTIWLSINATRATLTCIRTQAARNVFLASMHTPQAQRHRPRISVSATQATTSRPTSRDFGEIA